MSRRECDSRDGKCTLFQSWPVSAITFQSTEWAVTDLVRLQPRRVLASPIEAGLASCVIGILTWDVGLSGQWLKKAVPSKKTKWRRYFLCHATVSKIEPGLLSQATVTYPPGLSAATAPWFETYFEPTDEVRFQNGSRFLRTQRRKAIEHIRAA